MSWSAVLSHHAKLKDPQRELPATVCLDVNDETLTIFDGYEKAKYHFLILPRDPFPVSNKNDRAISAGQLDSLSSLMKSPQKLRVLKALERQADKIKAMIRDEMKKEYGFEWEIRTGFHAVESMKHVHLHVISSDMISDRLKNKKHWNSFHPTLGYFLHLSDVISQVETDKTFHFKPTPTYESILKRDLTTSYPPYSRTFKNVPELKRHLVEEWELVRAQSLDDEKTQRRRPGGGLVGREHGSVADTPPKGEESQTRRTLPQPLDRGDREGKNDDQDERKKEKKKDNKKRASSPLPVESSGSPTTTATTSSRLANKVQKIGTDSKE